MNTLDAFQEEISKKPTWSSKELTSKIQSVRDTITNKLQANGMLDSSKSSKKISVSIIKKYDIVYLPTGGIPHYILVYKVSNESVIGVIFTSKDKVHSLHQIKGDRFFIDNYATNGFVTVSIDDCFKNFVRVFENKNEADLIFKKVSDYLTDILLNKSKKYKSQMVRNFEAIENIDNKIEVEII